MNGKQLKNSILQWAIQGKLVPQDPNDEPASVLLERIRAEKARLVKEGKIKKDKNESIIFRGDDNSHYEKFLATGEVKCIDDEIPFEIPAGWAWCKIKHICTMQAGKNISASKIFAEYSELHPYRCVGGNGLRGYTESYNTSGHYSIVGRQGALCGCLNIENGDFYATEHAVVVDAYDIVPTTFIYYFLTALNLNQYATATAQPGLAVSNIIEVMFPLPPIQEQQRIVEQIKLIMPLVNKYEQSRSKLDSLNKTIYTQLKKSILQEAIQGRLVPQDSNDESASVLLERIKEEKTKLFKAGKLKNKDLVDSVIFKGDDNKYYERINGKLLDVSEEIPFDIPDSWRWARIKALFQTTSGGTPEKGHPEYYGGDIPWVKVGDLTDIYLAEASETISQSGYQNSSAKLFPVGTILVAMYCNDAIGKSSILTNPMTTNQAICGLYPNVHLCKEYIYYAIQANKGRLQEQAAGGAQKNINQKIVNELLLPIPPREEQDRIVNRIRDINNCL